MQGAPCWAGAVCRALGLGGADRLRLFLSGGLNVSAPLLDPGHDVGSKYLYIRCNEAALDLGPPWVLYPWGCDGCSQQVMGQLAPPA